jgi:hypothetical protein
MYLIRYVLQRKLYHINVVAVNEVKSETRFQISNIACHKSPLEDRTTNHLPIEGEYTGPSHKPVKYNPVLQKMSCLCISFVIIFKCDKLICRILLERRNPCQSLKIAFVKCSAKVMVLQTKQTTEIARKPERRNALLALIQYVVSGSKTFRLNKIDFGACQYILCWNIIYIYIHIFCDPKQKYAILTHFCFLCKTQNKELKKEYLTF